MKYLLLLSALLFSSAAPAQAMWLWFPESRPARTRLVCNSNGCRVRFRGPKVRINENCVYKPWKDRTVCRY